MEVSEQIIQVLNAVCEKFGIVINWSTKNVLPYIQDLISRIVLYEAVTSVLWLLIFVGAFVFAIKRVTVHRKGLKGLDWWDDEFDFHVICMIIDIFLIGISILAVIVQLMDIVTCVTLPEKILFDYASNLMNQ